VASVAADLSAIAPSLPPPGRPDVAPPSGPSGAFADLLDASAAPAPAPQPQQASASETGDGSNAAQTAGAAGGGSSSPSPAGAAPSSGRSKDSGGSKSTGDSADDSNSAGTAGANITMVAGLTVPPFAFAPLPPANQTSYASQDTQTTSAGDAAPAQDGTGGPPSDHKDSDPPSDPIAAGIAAAIPGLVPVVTVVAPASSAPAGTNPVGSLPSGASVPADRSSAPSAGAPSTESNGPDVAQPSAQPPNGTSQNSRPASTSVLDLLTAMAPAQSASPAAGELQTAVLPALASPAANSGAPDRDAQSTPAMPPVITPAKPSGTPTPAAALNPPAVVSPSIAANQVTAETATNTDAPRNAEPIAATLPTQIAVRFAAPAHADDDASSDNGSDVLRGTSIGGTAPPGSGQPGTAITPGFTGILSTMQTAPSAPTAPQHAAVTTDAVTLAAVPIAIVARAEGGERKFEIRLDPPDLGRIDVQLNVDSSGRATSHLIVDRATTLDLLRRDAPALEQALQSAGLTTDSGSLQFSLRDQSFAGREQALPAPITTPSIATSAEGEVAPIDTALRRYGPTAGLGGGIDIRV
jgi:flagellar hook-length control protein FliK